MEKPSRATLRMRQKRLFRDHSLPDACVAFRQEFRDHGGAVDHDKAQFFRDILDAWEPSRPDDQHFDDAVKALVAATLVAVTKPTDIFGAKESGDSGDAGDGGENPERTVP